MLLTVQGTSQVPVYSGWVFSWVPLSFLGSSNVSLRSWFYLQCTQRLFQLLLEVWVLAVYSMSDLTQVSRVEIDLAVVSVVQKLDCSVNCRGISASFIGTQDGLVSCCSVLVFSLFYSSHCLSHLVFSHQWKEENACDRHFQIKTIINFLPRSSVISCSGQEETRIGCVHWS